MPELTYGEVDESRRQTAGLVAWGGEVTSFLSDSETGSGLPAEEVAEGCVIVSSAIEADAHSIGPRCHELRINDEDVTWRIIYRVDEDAVVVVDVFSKKTAKTPKRALEVCRQRLRKYDHA
jgi:Phage derived protein Gp49-like (DUF891)